MKDETPEDDDDMIQITDENRELIFNILEIDTEKLVCAYCGEKILKTNVAIYSIDHKGKDYKLCCGDSILCNTEAMAEWDAVKEEISKTKGVKDYEAEISELKESVKYYKLHADANRGAMLSERIRLRTKIEKLIEENKFLRGGKIMTANNEEVLSKDVANDVIRKLKASRRQLAYILWTHIGSPDDLKIEGRTINVEKKERGIKLWEEMSER